MGVGDRPEARAQPHRALPEILDPDLVGPHILPILRRRLLLQIDRLHGNPDVVGGATVHLGHPRTRRSSRSEEHTSELQSLMRISYAVVCLKKKKIKKYQVHNI